MREYRQLTEDDRIEIYFSSPVMVLLPDEKRV